MGQQECFLTKPDGQAEEMPTSNSRNVPKVTQFSLLIVVACCLLCSCTANGNVLKDSPAADASIAGFWLGLWHGIISPVTFAVSLFRDDVNIYETRNNGGWYNFGFLWGVLIVFGSAGRASAKEEMQQRGRGGSNV